MSSLPVQEGDVPAVVPQNQSVANPASTGVAGYGDPVRGGFDAMGVSPFSRYLDLFVKHWRLAAAITTAFFLVGVIITFLMPRIYTATTSIQIDREAARVLRSQEVEAENQNDPLFYTTQNELLRSRALAERVVSALSLADRRGFVNAESGVLRMLWDRFFVPREADESEAARLRRKAIDEVMKNLTVQPVVMSRIVRVSFTSRSPALAQEISAAVAENFVSMTLDRRFSASSYARSFLEEKLQQVKLKLEESEKQVVAYAQKEGIVNVDDKVSVSAAGLKSLNDSLSAATSERIKTEQLWAQAQADNGVSLPQVLKDRIIETVREKRTQLAAEYQDKLRLMKPDFPEMSQLRAQIGEYDRQISHQIDLVKRSIKLEYETARDQEASFNKKIESLKAEVLDLRNRSILYNILQRELDTNRSLYDGLLQQYKDVGVTGAVSTNNVAIIDKAEKPLWPSSPSLLLNFPLALFLGLLASIATIAVVEILDDTFKSPEEVEEMLGLSTLGVIPVTEDQADKKKAKETLNLAREIIGNPLSPLAEAFRSLRTALQFSTPSGAPKVLLVTSSQPHEGKSVTALCLAANFAQLGMRVLLIDCDLRNPSLHKALQVDNSVGLSNVLTGLRDSSSVAQENVIAGVTFMASGPIPPNPAELIAGPQMASMLTMAGEKFDIVIIDGPPTMGLADAPLIGSLVDGALLVVDASHTRRRMVAASLKRLYFSRTPVVGVLLNKCDSRKANQSYGYGQYGGLSYYDYGVSESGESSTPSRPVG